MALLTTAIAIAATAAPGVTARGAVHDPEKNAASLSLRCPSRERDCRLRVELRSGELRIGRPQRVLIRAGTQKTVRFRVGGRGTEALEFNGSEARLLVRPTRGGRSQRLRLRFATRLDCRTAGTTLASSPTARAFLVDDVGSFACRFADPQPPVRLEEESDSDVVSAATSLHRLAGDFVAYQRATFWKCTEAQMKVVDLVTGRTVRTTTPGTMTTSLAHGCTGSAGTSDLVLHPSGAIAWIARPGDDGDGEVRSAAAAGEQLLERSRTIDGTSLELEGTTLTWRSGDVQRRATL